MDDNTVVQTEETVDEVKTEATVDAEEVSQAETAQEEVLRTEDSSEDVRTSASSEEVTPQETAEGADVEAAETKAQEESTVEVQKATESEAECSKVDARIDEVVNTLAELSAKMDEMNHLFVQKIQHTTHEEKIVDQMHAELQKYKEDMYAKLVRPILMDIIEVRDSIQRMTKSYAEKGGDNPTIPLKVFSDYAYDIQDILEKNDITIYQGQAGDAFSPMKQRALKKVSTPVEELHGKVAESLSCGYEYQGKTISPEKVVVFFYEKPADTEGENK